MSDQGESDFPEALWVISRGALILVLFVGLTTLIVLAGGAADPPRAGRLSFSRGSLQGTATGSGTTLIGDPIVLPDGPYTLEITAALSADSAPDTVWGVSFDSTSDSTRDSARDSASDSASVLMNGYGFLSMPPFQPDYRPFIHVRPNAQPNKITVNVERGNAVTIRINDEIAWQGQIVLAKRAQIQLRDISGNGAGLRIDQIALYAP